jgi:hypothetical protein
MFTYWRRKMGRNRVAFDVEQMLELIGQGMGDKDIAANMGVSIPTLKSRIAELEEKESAILHYSKVQHIELLDVQQRLIAGVTDAKIAEAPLGQIANAFGIFKKAEHLNTGKPTEIVGLMGYLLTLEAEEIAKSQPNQVDDAGDVVDVEVENG